LFFVWRKSFFLWFFSLYFHILLVKKIARGRKDILKAFLNFRPEKLKQYLT
jgi:hypothetical protein